jgi:capsule biosynthesis phosphatase
MIVIIPIGGVGQRFKDNGYTKSKTLINIFGKPILYHLLDSLNLTKIDYIYIPYNIEYDKYNFESMLRNDYDNIKFKFFKLVNNTRGAAETINIAIRQLVEDEKDKPILCLDSDNFYSVDIINKWNGCNCVFTIHDTMSKPIYSYVKTDDDNSQDILDIKEKVKISDYACTGAYGFDSVRQLYKYTSKIIENDIRQQSEFYTSGVIKEMINDNLKFKNFVIDKKNFICLGTPLQLKQYFNNFPNKSCISNNCTIKPKRICFDLDNTLVTYPDIKGDYTTVKPIDKNISLLRYLKKFNNTIIIYTARRMKTHNGNIGKINADVGKITFDTLDKFDIPYDEIYFGKPHADFYIDDLAINCFHDIEKELGFYQNTIIDTRDFNSINYDVSIETIIKNGIDLSGEIYYYSNIPYDLKDMFPFFITNNKEKTSFQVEKIHGLVVSDMYLSEILSEDILIHIMKSIQRIQNTKIVNDDINIYSNYSLKIKKRWNEYDYNTLKNSKLVYEEFISKLNLYEECGLGKKTVIHGDPVFTNIIINSYDKIKFIDMRGKVGDKLTIEGDWLYDWAKLFQSLIGYDSILLSKNISENYQKKMIECFKTFFINNYSENDFNNLKLITKSLLFTLLPLHKNEKCKLYYNLIFSDYLI